MGDLERVYGYFPRLKERRAAQAGYASGGEQQMCAIGRAMMSRPKLILLDEPSMGLAPQVVEEIFAIVRYLNKQEGVSFLLADRTPTSRFRSRISAISSRPGAWCSTARPRRCAETRTCANSTSASAGPIAARSRPSRATGAASAGWPETTRGEPMTDQARFEALRARLGELHRRSPALARQFGGLDLGELRGPGDLALIPVMRKSTIAEMQAAEPPLGGLAVAPTSAFPRLFASPGGIHKPESAGRDPWGAAKALTAAGVAAGEIVVNCFSYHLTPGGRILESGALALGCSVIPAGPGNTELLIAAIAHFKPSVYCGPPDFLKIVLDKARMGGVDLSALNKAMVSGAALPPSLTPSSSALASRRARRMPPPISKSSPTRPTAPTGLFCPACLSTMNSWSRS